MKAVAAERRRFGYRRIHVMLERQGIVMNLKKLRRLYREERLQVRRRGGRKRALGTRRPMLVPDAPNQRWSLDFVSDALTDEPLVISSLAASCCCCAENPLIPAVQIFAAISDHSGTGILWDSIGTGHARSCCRACIIWLG